MRVSVNEDKIEIEKKIRNAERTIGCIIIELEKKVKIYLVMSYQK